MSPTVKAWLADTAERCERTFAQAFLAVYGTQGILDLAGGHPDVSLAYQALQAGVAAVLAIVTAALAAPIKGTISPASFAPAQQPGQAEQDAPSPVT